MSARVSTVYTRFAHSLVQESELATATVRLPPFISLLVDMLNIKRLGATEAP